MRSGIGWFAAVVALVVTVVVIGTQTPVRRAGTAGVALGPVSGQQVGQYLLRTLDLPPAGGPYWALVSLRSELSATAAAGLLGPERLSRAVLRVPIPRVQTAQITADFADQGPRAAELTAAMGTAGSKLQQNAESGDGRTAAVARVSAARLRHGCACVLALLVHGSAEQLRALAAQPAVRAVDVAPAGTALRELSLTPLLPEQTSVVVPSADDGLVPPG